MFSVLTLNLRFGLADDGPNSWIYRQKSFPAFLRRYRTDFIALQEVNDFQLDFMSGLLPDYTCIGERTPAPAFWQNNLIFFHRDWKCNYREHFFLSPTPDIPSRSRKSRWPRQCTMGLFVRKNRELVCVNTHFDFDATVRTESARLIMDRLSRFGEQVPAVLLGDFNSPPSDPCHRVFAGPENCLKKEPHHFHNVFQAPYPGTHHGFTGKPDGDYIDWVLYRGPLGLRDRLVIQENFGQRFLSDHYPVKAVFRWEGGVRTIRPDGRQPDKTSTK